MTFFEIYEDVQGYYRWRLKGGNGEIVASSEAYYNQAGATQSAIDLKRWSNTNDIRKI